MNAGDMAKFAGLALERLDVAGEDATLFLYGNSNRVIVYLYPSSFALLFILLSSTSRIRKIRLPDILQYCFRNFFHEIIKFFHDRCFVMLIHYVQK